MNESDERTTSAVAWYREDQWDRLRELSDDRDDLAETHAEWLEMIERKWSELTATGLQLRRVAVDVEDLWSWCRSNGRVLDGSARSEYVARRARELMQRGELE